MMDVLIHDAKKVSVKTEGPFSGGCVRDFKTFSLEVIDEDNCKHVITLFTTNLNLKWPIEKENGTK